MVSVGKSNIDEVRALTPAQEGILFHTLLAPGSAQYVQQYVCRLDGELDVARFRRSWEVVIARHPALRSLFTWEGRERPLQVVRSEVTAPWSIVELGEVGDIDGFLAEDARRGFDLEVAPLLRLYLIADADGHHFVWTHHHLILDGWSLGIVMDEVWSTYSALLRGEHPDLETPAQHSAYLRWQDQRDEVDAESHWKAALEGIEDPTRISVGKRPGSPWARVQGKVELALTIDETADLHRFAAKSSITVGTLLRAAWAIVVSHYSNTTDVLFGAVVAGRPPEVPGSMEMVGLYLNTIPIRVDTGSNLDIGTWLSGLERDRNTASEFESTPLPDIQRWSSLPAGESLFDTLLAVENVPTAQPPSAGISIGQVRYLQQSHYTLALLVMPGASLELTLLHDADRVSTAIAAQALRHVRNVLSSLQTVHAVSEIQLMAPDEVEKLRSWSTAPSGQKRPLTFPEHLDAMLVASGRAETAIIEGDRSISYAELMTRANHVVSELSRWGVGPRDTIALIATRSLEATTVMVALSMAGIAYAPVLPSQPAKRMVQILDEANFAAVVAEDPDLVPDLEGRPLIALAELASAGGSSPATSDIESRPDPDDIAYVMYTSGSTGLPKAVEVSHGNLGYSTSARFDHYDTAVGRFLWLSPIHFDSSVVGLYWSLASGGTLVIAPAGSERDAAALVGGIRDRAITHTLMLPSLYDAVLRHADPGDLSSLEVVIVAGETCPPDLVDAHREVAPQAELHNEYGPTEATVWSTVARLHPPGTSSADPGERVPIGRPIPGATSLVLDSAGRLCPVGVHGDLHVAGPGVARGYRGDPSLSERRFTERSINGGPKQRSYRTGDIAAWRPDGMLDFFGRVDNQVKIRGHRVELDEIDAALMEVPDVVRSATVLIGPGADSKRLVAFVEPALDPAYLTAQTRERIPDVMIPDLFITMSSLPLGPTGKVNRTLLESWDLPTRPESTGILDGPTEVALAAIWRDVLGLDQVGPTDDFFELGGDSLLGIRIIARAHEAGITIAAGDFYDHPTVRGMALAASSG